MSFNVVYWKHDINFKTLNQCSRHVQLERYYHYKVLVSVKLQENDKHHIGCVFYRLVCLFLSRG